MKKLLFISFLLTSQIFFGQFSNLKSKLGKSLIHNSIAKSKPASGFYVVASTIKLGNNYDINVAKVNSFGVTIWEREIDLKQDDRVLDVTVDDNDFIYITGYTGTRNMKQLYIVKLNSRGVIIDDFILESTINTIGTKILKSKNSKNIYIGGFTYTNEKPYNMISKALLISVSYDLKKLNWEAEYSLSQVNNTITDVVELPDSNLFITGSLGKNQTGQIILAAIVNPNKNGDLITNGNLSFGVAEDYCLGASAVYDPSFDQIWLLFNAGSNGKPHYIGIKNATSIEPSLLPNGIVIDINNTPKDKYAAYKIMLSPNNANRLTIFGYKDYTGRYNSGFGMWAVEIDRNHGMLRGGLKLWNPSGSTINLEHQGGDVLSLFSSKGTGMPYFHSPDMAIESHDEKKFVALTLDDVSGVTEVGLLSFSNNLQQSTSSCFRFLDPLRYKFTTLPKGIDKQSNFHSSSSSQVIASFAHPSNQSYCSIFPIQASDKSETSNKTSSSLKKLFDNSKLTVYPNPSSGVVNITLEGKGSFREVKLLNNLGQVIILKSIKGTKNKLSINLEGLKSGVYILMIEGANGKTKSERIVKL